MPALSSLLRRRGRAPSGDMNGLALDLAARAMTLDGVSFDQDYRMFYMDNEIGNISAVGASVFVEVQAHPQDAEVLVLECPQCSACPEPERAREGWITFDFVSHPDSYTLSFFMESIRSAIERLLGA